MDWLNVGALQKIKIENTQGLEACLGKSKQSFNYENFYLECLKQMRTQASTSLYNKKPKVAKNSTKALELKDAGKEVLWYCVDDGNQSGDIIKAIKLFTQSIANSLSDELFGYVSRSRALFRAKRFFECAEDINRYLSTRVTEDCFYLSIAGVTEPCYPDDSLRAELNSTLAKCFKQLAISNYEEAKFWLSKFPLGEDNQKSYDERLKHYQLKKCNVSLEDEETIVPTIERPNKKFPSISSAIDVKFSKEFERHFVATRNIQVGEVLIVEEPYVKSPKQDNFYSHCHHCLRVMWAGIPCEHCVNALYCWRECQTTAWNQYHQYECTYLDLLLSYGNKDFEALAARCLFKAVTESGGVQKLKDKIGKLNFSSGPVWPFRAEWYQNGTIESIVSQVTNAEKMPFDLLKEMALHAVRSTFFLACTTDFFGIQYDWNRMTDEHILKLMSENDQVKFIGGLLFKLLLIALNNSQEFPEDGSPNLRVSFEDVNQTMENERGSVLLPVLNLMNVSCFYNTCKQYKRNHVVLYAALPIKKGDQVFDTHGHDYLEKSKSERQMIIQQKFYFTCNCIACRGNWPKLKIVDSWDGPICVSFTSNYSLHLCYVKSMEIVKKAREGNCSYQEKVEMLKEFCKGFQECFRGIRLPNSRLSSLINWNQEMLHSTGNSSMLRLLQSHGDQ